MAWQPTPDWRRRYRQALYNAFDAPSLELLTVDHFAPHTFSRVAPEGLGKTFEVRLMELIETARMEDWLTDLVAATRERRPRNADIAAIADELGLTIDGPRIDNRTGTGLEALVRQHATFITPATFREQLAFLEGRVCWIDVPNGGGTGFLVGADVVMTNQHVIAPITDGRALPSDVRCLFDYRQPIDGVDLTRKQTTTIRLGQEGVIASSPPSPGDEQPALGDATTNQLDYALIRLDERVGEHAIGGASADPTAEPRGWITVDATAPAVAAGTQVFLLQHPRGEPLQLAIGEVVEFNASGTRVRHDANSKNGSSGSPLFDTDLRLIALHHAHDPAYPPAWNQAIPSVAIHQDWQAHGITVD